jgi:hypothetical protein
MLDVCQRRTTHALGLDAMATGLPKLPLQRNLAPPLLGDEI